MIGRKFSQKTRVLFQDDVLLAMAKPSGLLVHRGYDNDPLTLADIARDQVVHAPVHAVHRLDRGTSGIVLFALTPDAARLMQTALSAADKRYIALVRGPMKEAVMLDHPVPSERGGERVRAVTQFRPLETVDRWTMVGARPTTGRMHQIRRHLKHLSHPVVGDVRYGKGDINRLFREQYGLERLALHLERLAILHPNGHVLNLVCPLPDDLRKPFEKIGFALADVQPK